MMIISWQLWSYFLNVVEKCIEKLKMSIVCEWTSSSESSESITIIKLGEICEVTHGQMGLLYINPTGGRPFWPEVQLLPISQVHTSRCILIYFIWNKNGKCGAIYQILILILPPQQTQSQQHSIWALG